MIAKSDISDTTAAISHEGAKFEMIAKSDISDTAVCGGEQTTSLR